MPLATPVALPLKAWPSRIHLGRPPEDRSGAAPFRADHRAFHGRRQADVTELEKKRAGLEQLIGRRLSLLPFVLTAVAKALREHPILNANVDDFVEEIHLESHVHLGCAVDTEHGLMVPVIKDADTLSVVQLADSSPPWPPDVATAASIASS